MDYKVVSPAEYFSNGEAVPSNGAGYAHMPIMPTGAPVAYPFHPTDGFAYANQGTAIRPPNGPPPPGTTTYFTPQQGYFQAPSANAANLPNVSYASANPAAAPPGQVPLQRRPPTGRPINAEPSITKETQQNTNNPKRFDGAGDVDEEKSPDEILQLLFKKKSDAEDEAGDLNSVVDAPAGSREEDDLINSDLDDDDEDDDDEDDEDDVDAGTMDENVLLCQYEKVARTRNKWRCVFKSGLIHVNGVDYAFSRANGEFEW